MRQSSENWPAWNLHQGAKDGGPGFFPCELYLPPLFPFPLLVQYFDSKAGKFLVRGKGIRDKGAKYTHLHAERKCFHL